MKEIYEVKIAADTQTAHIKITPGKTMRAIVLSDLHLSTDHDANDNYRTDLELANRFQRALNQGKAIFLDGDIVEGWQRDKKYFAEDLKILREKVSKCNSDATKKQAFLDWHKEVELKIYANVKKAFPKTFALIAQHNNKQIFYIKGNHDSNIGILNSVVLSNGKYSGRISHGHEHDSSNKDNSVVSRIITAVGGQLEQIFTRKMDEIFNIFAADHTNDTMASIKKGNIALAKQHGFAFIITGHTHHGLLETINKGKTLNANCGQGIYLKDCNDEIEFTVGPNGINVKYQQYNHKKPLNPIRVMAQARLFCTGPWVGNTNIAHKMELYQPPQLFQGFFNRAKSPRKKELPKPRVTSRNALLIA